MTSADSPAERWTVAVLGPGGVGGLLAGLLARAGHQVVCVAGETTVNSLRKRGISVRSGRFGEFSVPVAARTVLRGPVDACVIATKETALAAALDRVPPEALGTGLVLPLLNGFEHVARLRERYPAKLVVPGTIRVESARTGPGRIVHVSPVTAIELSSRTAPGERVATLGAVLSDAGLRVTVRKPGEEDAMLWEKLALLLPLALFTTRYGVPLGVVRTEYRDDLLAVVDEFVRVARTVGVGIAPDAVVRALDAEPETMRSSMQRDAEAGRPLELDAIALAVLRQAHRTATGAPVMEQLATAVAGAQRWR